MKKNLAAFFCLAFSLQCAAQITGISVEIVMEHDSVAIPELAGHTTYRVYADVTSSTDFISAVYGNQDSPLMLGTDGAFFQDAFAGNFAQMVVPSLFSFFPTLEFDSWLTIGISNSDEGSSVQNTPSVLVDAFAAFNAGEGFVVNDPIGGTWFNELQCLTDLETCADEDLAFGGADNRVLLAQLTSTGDVYGVFNVRVFLAGDQDSFVDQTLVFSSAPNAIVGCYNQDACNFNMEATIEFCEYPDVGYDCLGNCLLDEDGDGNCDLALGCTDAAACNFDPTASVDDSSCDFCTCANSGYIFCDDPEAINFGMNHANGCVSFGGASIHAGGNYIQLMLVDGEIVIENVELQCPTFNLDAIDLHIGTQADFLESYEPLEVLLHSQSTNYSGNYTDIPPINEGWDEWQQSSGYYEVPYPDSITFVFDCGPITYPTPTIVLNEGSSQPVLEMVSDTLFTIQDGDWDIRDSATIEISGLLSGFDFNESYHYVVFGNLEQYSTSDSVEIELSNNNYWPYSSYWHYSSFNELELEQGDSGTYQFQIPLEDMFFFDYDADCSPNFFVQLIVPDCGLSALGIFEISVDKVGCADANACNFDWFPCASGGVCDYESCSGCSDPFASNFSFAEIDDGSCEYPWDVCGDLGELSNYPLLRPLFHNYNESSIPVSWVSVIEPFYYFVDTLYGSSWSDYSAEEQNWLWNEGQVDQSFNPGSPTILPFDSISVGGGILEDEAIVMCVPKFLAEPLSGLPFGLSSLELDSVVGMPPGLSLEFTDSLYSSLSAACIPLVGEAQETGCFPITIHGEAMVTLFGQPIVFDDLEVDYKICVGGLSGQTESTCQDSTACNFGELGPDCLFLDECGDCGGSGIEEGGCDCEGNVLDALGVCGGECSWDEDNDGICDDVDDCIGELDSCGICGGDNTACMGCTYHEATNFNQASVVDDGSCVFDLGDSCQGDLNYDSVIGIDDILLMLSVYDTTCPQ